MAQRLGAHVALAENSVSVTSTCIWQPTNSCNPRSSRLNRYAVYAYNQYRQNLHTHTAKFFIFRYIDSYVKLRFIIIIILHTQMLCMHIYASHAEAKKDTGYPGTGVTGETEVDESLNSEHSLQSVFQDSQAYKEKPCLKKQTDFKTSFKSVLQEKHKCKILLF